MAKWLGPISLLSTFTSSKTLQDRVESQYKMDLLPLRTRHGRKMISKRTGLSRSALHGGDSLIGFISTDPRSGANSGMNQIPPVTELFDQAVVATTQERHGFAERIAKDIIDKQASTVPLVNVIVSKALNPEMCLSAAGCGVDILCDIVVKVVGELGFNQRGEFVGYLTEVILKKTKSNWAIDSETFGSMYRERGQWGHETHLQNHIRCALSFSRFVGELFIRDVISRLTVDECLCVILDSIQPHSAYVDSLVGATLILDRAGPKIWDCLDLQGKFTTFLRPKIEQVERLMRRLRVAERLVIEAGDMTIVSRGVIASAKDMSREDVSAKGVVDRLFKVIDSYGGLPFDNFEA
ncbi:hypothetical protein JR316_0008636 [Psilocybe cubensis]|uniref:Uncharacterized protein n=2 Tax=Psilocybe cubensis TaxID=181762 RepID=A0A8H7XY44_PSICU|nr:hypothetical protein JR316_0008636 [Psilocybe cubensis]KAH9478183.1 hypothetical protein JR316_0008636 [Psilocybe cubensis]